MKSENRLPADRRSTPESHIQGLEQARLSAVLGSIRQSNTFELTEWQVQSLAKGSITGNAFRVIGAGADNGSPVHWSLILKFVPSPDSDQADALVQFGDEPSRWNYWKRELHFYQSDLPGSLPTGLAAPHCYHVEEQPDGYWLWLEDVDDMYAQHWPVARFGLAAQHLARFNGAYLLGTDMPIYPWLVKDKDFVREWEGRVIRADALAKIEQLHRKNPLVRRGWPDDVLAGFSRLWHERASIFAAVGRLPKTLQHADGGHKNLLARRDKEGNEETVVLDWALVGIGTIGEEIATLVCSTLGFGGVAMSQASELETVVLDGYIQGLQAIGWDGDPKLVRFGYLASVVLRYGFFVTLTPEFIVLANSENAEWLEAMYEQPLDTIIDNRVKLRRFIVDRADEALALMAEI